MGKIRIPSVRGVKFLTPKEASNLSQIRQRARDAAHTYGFRAVELPILEHEELYLRSVAESDLVQKEVTTLSYEADVLRPRWW